MAMSSGMYHRRWANVGNDSGSSRTVQRSENITQTIAPHTYGTSWNSVRWNKPLENGRGCWSRTMPFFESISKDYRTKSSYSVPPLECFVSQSASKNNIELKNSGPHIRERSSCFGDSVLSMMNDKTSSTTSRLSWLSDNLKNRKNITYNKVARNSGRNDFTANSRWTPTSSSASRSFQSIRNTVPALSSSSASTSLHNRPFLNNTSQTISSSNHGNAVIRADRPWRRRMADSARLRSVHGDEIGGAVNSTLATIRARLNSIPNGRNYISNSANELRTSLTALKNYIDEQTTSFCQQNNQFSARDSPIFTDKLSFANSMISVKRRTPTHGFYSTQSKSGRFPEYMSRSYSPIRSRSSAYNSAKLSKYNSISADMLLRSLRFSSNANNVCENVKSHVLDQVIRSSPIPENICERESNGRLLSNKERTLRHHLRQRKLGVESNSSSDTEQQQQTEIRKPKLRKRSKKKFKNESKSEREQLQANAEKRLMIIDNKMSVKTDTQKENATDEMEMQRNQILNSAEETSSLITFPAAYSMESDLSMKSTEFDQGNKCMESKKIPTGMQKMQNIDVELADEREKFCLDQISPSRPLSPITLSSFSSIMITSIDDHFEASEECRNGVNQFDSSGIVRRCIGPLLAIVFG
ncbi:unnamed protein product [Cercopithifilaria johnstoni]|uniref:Uncharacterized protein n=1 Tax=Cercopithifilaria johnstoni TaxID=2874296 RepID=A0A8J2MMU8_9BILA|nr:unnamed protein product [Cercopithifilaria johnstoni]